jgi:TPR repeat protein
MEDRMATIFARTHLQFSRFSRRAVFFTVAIFLIASTARAADDTARFYGTWKAYVPLNGQTITLISIHDENGYQNFVRQPAGGDTPAGTGTFSAANGKYKTSAGFPNDGGFYKFMGNDTVVCTNLAGQVVTWKRLKPDTPEPRAPAGHVDANVAARNTTGYVPPSGRPGTERLNPGGSTASNPQPVTPSPGASVSDPSLPPDVNAGLAAMNRKDYVTAWREFTTAAQRGDSDGQFGLGAMLFNHMNPPGTGYYAQCEKWLTLSANQGNDRGMEFLARYYFESGRNMAGGINPGVNNAPTSSGEQSQADRQFRKARQWFERSADKGDLYSMANLAVMLDGGVGGPRDPNRAAQLRAQVKAGPNKKLIHDATDDPGSLATAATWQSGHYADAIKAAQAAAAKGDANAEALLGKAYFEGVGVQRNYATALTWLNKAVAQDNADGMFILGLMYEHGWGVTQDIPKSEGLFDRARFKGQHYAAMEVTGMRMQGQINKQAAEARRRGGNDVMDTACGVAGGIPVGPECVKGGATIDPFNAEQANAPPE